MVVTSDNPRTEDPDEIISADHRRPGEGRAAPHVAPGKAKAGEKGYLVEADRRGGHRARGVSLAKPGDVVLIAGKGHEAYQIIGDEKLPVRRPGRGARGAGQAPGAA